MIWDRRDLKIRDAEKVMLDMIEREFHEKEVRGMAAGRAMSDPYYLIRLTNNPGRVRI